jgi:hypothetical protein
VRRVLRELSTITPGTANLAIFFSNESWAAAMATANGPNTNQRAWTRCSLSELESLGSHHLLGQLCDGSARAGYDVDERQIHAWKIELECLAHAYTQFAARVPTANEWPLLFEYSIPRRGRRIDVVALAGSVVIVIEFKVGSASFDRSAVWQAEDYALDLRDFHLATRDRTVIPILVATEHAGPLQRRRGDELDVVCVGSQGLAMALAEIPPTVDQIDPKAWDASAYSPTPNIVEATRHLFASHTVAELSHSYADNLTGTVERLGELVERARTDRRRLVCFVTGVPGAGKTLAGLAAASAIGRDDGDDHRAAYMSGNGPLIQVLREAVARDAKDRLKTIREARRYAGTLVQNVHEFTELYGVHRRDLAPDEHVVVFDEAQRAWHAAKLKKRYPTVDASEPELMLDIMSRQPEWCALIALVGGGQEIHDGEAGLQAWGRALEASDVDWAIAASGEVLSGGPSVAGSGLVPPGSGLGTRVTVEPLCHLSVSVRSPRARRIADWVDAVLACQPERARAALEGLTGFRLAMTRDLEAARGWLRDASRGEMRPGLLASSTAIRLRADGIEMTPEFLSAYPIERWFLDGPDDFRSSHSLEVALSEFKVQGLEIDLAGVCWSGDLIPDDAGAGWIPRRLRGTRWHTVTDQAKQTYALNKYRVLLTRAREGMVIWVPDGDPADPTRDPSELDRVSRLLEDCGVPGL